MIEAEVLRGEGVIMKRTYLDQNLTLNDVLSSLQMYIRAEQMNLTDECLVRARFANLSKSF